MQPDTEAHTALVATAGVPDEVFEEHYYMMTEREQTEKALGTCATISRCVS